MRYTNLRNNENLEKCLFEGCGQYDIPQLHPEKYEGEHDFISFNYGKSLKTRKGKVCHFFIDDRGNARTNTKKYVGKGVFR